MTPSTATVAKVLQQCGVDWLTADRALTGVTIVGRREKNIVSDIEAAVKNLGVCIYVQPGRAIQFNYATGGPYAEAYELRTTIFEHPALNTQWPDAFELEEIVTRRLWNAEFPQAIPGMNPLVPPDGGRVGEIIADDELRIHEVVFHTSLGLLPRVDS